MSGSITIPNYPDSNRVPGVWAVVDASKANTGLPNQRALLVGQMLSGVGGGTANPGFPVISAGLGDAQTSFGAGSMLSVMVERYRAMDPTGELWCLPLADAGSATAASATITFTGGPATGPGTIYLYVNGNRVAVPVNTGDTATVIGASTASAINTWSSPGANPMEVTATAATGVVTLTARNKGTVANSFTVMLSYLGISGGDLAPAGQINIPGLTVPTITAFTGGATDPTIANFLPNLADQPYDFIISPYTDTTSMNAVQSFLGDQAGRWNWASGLFGHHFTAVQGTFGTRTTYGSGRNNQHESVISYYNSPSPPIYWAVDFGAASCITLRADPALPVGGLGGGMKMNVVAPHVADRDTFNERASLLYDGLTTFVADASGQVMVERAITTYQYNAVGSRDNSYLDVNVPFCLMAYIRGLKQTLQTQFQRVKLVVDGSRIPVGQAMVTSQTIKYTVIADYVRQSNIGIVQNPTVFQQQVQAQNAGNGEVKLLLPVMLANQLYDIAMNVQFTRP
jgi:phage tail sheath gpL-like